MNKSVRYSATPQDRMNYLLSLYSADQQMVMVLQFPEELNTSLLVRALQLTLDYVPILNCHFVEEETPYWERIGDTKESILSIESCIEEEVDMKVSEFIIEPGDRTHGPMIQVKLFRSKKDTLCVKISHLCSDGTGLKEYMTLLAALYTRLYQGDEYEHVEKDVLNTFQDSFRDQKPLFTAVGITDIKTAMRQDENSASLWSFPSNPAENDKPAVALRRLAKKQMQALKIRTKESGVTINDVLLAAYFRSIANQAVYMESQTKEKGIGMTIDLRRYLPGQTTGTVCNLSGMEMPIIEMKDGERFIDTLNKVHTAMNRIKQNMPGVSSAAGMELMAEIPLSAAKERFGKQHEWAMNVKMALPLLTNFGVLSEEFIRFGHIDAEDGYMTAPIMYAPFFCVGVSTYQDTLTLSIGFHSPAVSMDRVKRLLDDMMGELTDWISFSSDVRS